MKAPDQCFSTRLQRKNLKCIAYVGVFSTTAFKNCLFSKIQVKTIMMTPEKNLTQTLQLLNKAFNVKACFQHERWWYCFLCFFIEIFTSLNT